MAVYGYDRIGRRVQKTMGTSEIRFIYDPAGRMIAEYANGEWIRDYVYGASGEAVYMRFPRTDEMIAAHDSFFGFLNAWLCSPYCTQDDLLWDINADNQINFVDWAADSNAFVGAFTINERFLLADSRNSVVGKVNLDSSVDLIAYTAFGAPYYAQGVDLEGLAVLWNGYYFDYETGNYYLRNRYYSPLERRFLTPDLHGVNPDGNWNNPFGVFQQYSDGFGLQVYAGGDPVNGRDPLGLSTSQCKKEKCCNISISIVPTDDEEREWNKKENAWIIDLNRRRKDEGKSEVTINGYYRHCVSTCRVSKSLRCMGIGGNMNLAFSFLAAMIGGNDYPPIDDNNERYDYLSDVYGIVLSKSPTSCACSCGAAMGSYMGLVEYDLKRRGK